jgi:hypothetical protein
MLASMGAMLITGEAKFLTTSAGTSIQVGSAGAGSAGAGSVGARESGTFCVMATLYTALGRDSRHRDTLLSVFCECLL